MTRRLIALFALIVMAGACGDRTVTRTASTPTSAAANGGSILDPRLGTGADGTPCVALGEKPGDPNGAAALENEQRTVRMQRTHPRCTDGLAVPKG